MKPHAPNRELILVVLYAAGGATDRVHTEDIAIQAHRMFPDSFSWSKYADYPDKDIVRVALVEAARPSNGAMVVGRTGRGRGHAKHRGRAPSTDGWSLTEAGLRWAKDHAVQIETTSKAAGPKAHRQQHQRTLARVRNHSLYDRFQSNGISSELPLGEMADLLRCRVDAEAAVWHERIEKLLKTAIDASDEPVAVFLNALRERIIG